MEELLPTLTGYGLPGLIVALIALYVWRVKIPADQKVADTQIEASKKRDDFIQTLVTDGAKKSEALVQTFRDDLEKRDDKFVKAIADVEASHRAGQSEIADAIREMRDGRSGGLAA